MHRIVEVEARPEYRVWIRFADGTAGEVDLRPLVGKGVFAAWNDPAAFARVRIDPATHTLVWDTDIDLCPESLYADVTRAAAATDRDASSSS